MARCCGNSGGCSCRVTNGFGVSITGTGSAGDPFVITNTAPGGGGSGDSPFFRPEDYDALGDGSDDTAALQAAIDAAFSAGGGTVILSSGSRYGWEGILRVRPSVLLLGTTTRQNLAPDAEPTVPGLVALSATAQLQVGNWEVGGHPQGIENVYVDGNFLGGTTTAKEGLVRITGVDLHIKSLFVVRSGGDGVVFDGVQNSSIFGLTTTFHVGPALVLDNGAGGLAFHGGYAGTSKGGALTCRNTAPEPDAYPFGPTHITFSGTLFEAYGGLDAPLDEPFSHHVQVSGRSIIFLGCNFTGGTATAANATVVIDDSASGFIPPTVNFVGCLWWVYPGHDAVRVVGNAQVTFEGQQEIGDNGIDHAVSFLCVDGGFPRVGINGEIVMAAPDDGLNIMRAINGGSIVGVYTLLDQGVTYRLRPEQAVGVRAVGAEQNQWQFESNGLLRWLFEGDGVTTAAATPSADGIVWSGRQTLADGHAYLPIPHYFTQVGETATLDVQASAEHRLVFFENATVTTVNLTNPVEGAQVRIILFSLSGGNTITWPANINWAATPPQPTFGAGISVDLTYFDTVGWYEVSRSHHAGGGGTGTVETVNGEAPDGSGNVALSAADVGARDATWVPAWSEVTSKPATASEAEAEAGTSSAERAWTPVRVRQGALAAVARISAWAKIPEAIITGTITRNADNVITSAQVVWPDGATGTFTTTTIGPLDTIDAYNITYDDGTTTLTFTQPTITRNASGFATTVPAITVA